LKPKVDADALRTRTIDGFDLNVEEDIQLASLAGQDCRGGFARQVTVPAKLHLARNADDTDPAAFTDRHVIWFKCLRLLPA
jgi:hypothetical protein